MKTSIKKKRDQRTYTNYYEKQWNEKFNRYLYLWVSLRGKPALIRRINYNRCWGINLSLSPSPPPCEISQSQWLKWTSSDVSHIFSQTHSRPRMKYRKPPAISPAYIRRSCSPLCSPSSPWCRYGTSRTNLYPQISHPATHHLSGTF